MNVASLDLCKELYELSGWKEADYVYYANAGEHSGTVGHKSQFFDKPENLPAYDLGYLLRKLPPDTRDEFDNHHYFVLEKVRGGQDGDYVARYDTEYFQQDDTPEDACAKLTLALFKEGILTK